VLLGFSKDSFCLRTLRCGLAQPAAFLLRRMVSSPAWAFDSQGIQMPWIAFTLPALIAFASAAWSRVVCSA
jgi:hypothetical protein